MSNLIFPQGYDPKLTLRETQRAIKLIKDTFQKELALALNLDRVTAPIIVKQGSGLNDEVSTMLKLVGQLDYLLVRTRERLRAKRRKQSGR